jgi:hypothetical protein
MNINNGNKDNKKMVTNIFLKKNNLKKSNYHKKSFKSNIKFIIMIKILKL